MNVFDSWDTKLRTITEEPAGTYSVPIKIIATLMDPLGFESRLVSCQLPLVILRLHQKALTSFVSIDTLFRLYFNNEFHVDRLRGDM